MSLIKHTATIGMYTLVSRVFGFVRDMLQAGIIGANAYSDAFFIAFKLPNFFRRIFAEGAFNAAFVPLFAGMLATEGKDPARRFATEIMSVLLVVLLTLTAFFILIMPWFMFVMAPGYAGNHAQFDLAVLLTRITFPYLLFISLVSLLGAILNGMDRFAAVAATPVLMNLCFIASLLVVWWWQPTPETGVMILAIGVTISGAAQLLWLMFFCRRIGMLPGLIRPRMTQNVRQMLQLIGPAALGGSVAQINLIVDIILASFLATEGSISFLFYADRISELPLAVIGIAVGTALLPMLSKRLRESRLDEAQHLQNRAIEFSLMLALPSSVALVVIATPIIATLYQHGAFTEIKTAATAPALMAFAVGLPAFVLAKIITPGFYARHDTATPFKIAVACVALNFLLNLILIVPLKHVGLAIATSTSGWVNAITLAIILHRRGHWKPDAALIRRAPRMLAASMLMGAVLAVILSLQPGAASVDKLQRIWHLALLITAGLIAYGTCILLFRAASLQQVRAYFIRNK